MSTITTIVSHGLTNHVVRVECMFSNGLPSTVIVGMAGRMITESRDRLRGAFIASRLKYPRRRIICNLVPASLPKIDTSLDLAVAVAILQTDDQLPMAISTEQAFIGELSLDGRLQPDPHIVAKVVAGKAAGIKQFFIPATNIEVASIVPDTILFPVQSLQELIDYSRQACDISPLHTGSDSLTLLPDSSDDPFEGIVGLTAVKRGLTIAAAGQHNMLLQGPPGAGKSLLAGALAQLLPYPNRQQLIAINRSNDSQTLCLERPVIRPHHTISTGQLIGSSLKPGLVVTADCGVLIMDELAEFNRASLEALRQPLEDHQLHFKDLIVPANFICVATTNPCPCGYFGSEKDCTCATYQRIRYQEKLSGPLLDRFDLHICFNSYEQQSLLSDNQHSLDTFDYKLAVLDASKRQSMRQNGRPNGRLTALQLRQYLQADPAARALLNQAAERFKLTHRSYLKVAAISRTIADIEGQDTVTSAHVAEALQYRPNGSST